MGRTIEFIRPLYVQHTLSSHSLSGSGWALSVYILADDDVAGDPIGQAERNVNYFSLSFIEEGILILATCVGGYITC